MEKFFVPHTRLVAEQQLLIAIHVQLGTVKRIQLTQQLLMNVRKTHFDWFKPEHVSGMPSIYLPIWL